MKTNFTLVVAMMLIALQTHSQTPNHVNLQFNNGAQSLNKNDEVLKPFNTNNDLNNNFKRINPYIETQSSVSLMDSNYIWIWDSLTNVWNIDSKIIFTYDNRNNMISYILERRKDGWVGL